MHQLPFVIPDILHRESILLFPDGNRLTTFRKNGGDVYRMMGRVTRGPNFEKIVHAKRLFMQQCSCPDEAQRMTENLMRALELTDVCLELRCAMLRQHCSPEEAAKQVMREVRQSKERAWKQSRS